MIETIGYENVKAMVIALVPAFLFVSGIAFVVWSLGRTKQGQSERPWNRKGK